MASGDLRAIRDWTNRFYYDKNQIGQFFAQRNSGLDAYNLRIIGPQNTTITIAETDQSPNQSYSFKTDAAGNYRGLFFFHTGATIRFTWAGEGTYDYTLSSYNDLIYLSPLTVATSAMSSNTTPNTIGTVSYILGENEEQSGLSNRYFPFKGYESDGRYGLPCENPLCTNDKYKYIGAIPVIYCFNDPVIIYKMDIYHGRPKYYSYNFIYYTYKILAGNDINNLQVIASSRIPGNGCNYPGIDSLNYTVWKYCVQKGYGPRWSMTIQNPAPYKYYGMAFAVDSPSSPGTLTNGGAITIQEVNNIVFYKL